MSVPALADPPKVQTGAVMGEPVVFDLAKESWNIERVLEHFHAFGFVHIRNLMPPDRFKSIVDRAKVLLAKPAVAGTIGYAKIDHPKKIANPFLLRNAFVQLAADKRIIDFAERCMNSDCVLAEATLKFDSPVGYEYFSMHADFAPGWRKSPTALPVLSREDLDNCIGVGGVVYLHETHSGAFTYCIGTHKLKAYRGQDTFAYPEAEQRKIMAARRRLDGQAGDVVLFDDRGFHGPDQPATAERTVILLDYYRVKTFGHTQVSPLQIYTADLVDLDAQQLRVLGVGAGEMVAPEEYLLTKFQRSKAYGQCIKLIDGAYRGAHLKNKLKHKLGDRGMGVVRRLTGRSLKTRRANLDV